MPIQHKNHKQEHFSRRQFEEIIEPWTIINYNSKDYGIDITVEFTSPLRGTENVEMLGRFLNVQLKSQTKTLKNNSFTSVTIEVDKIKYWFNSNVPVILSVFVVPTRKFYFRHINQDLINEIEKEDKNWLSHATKRIKIPYSSDLSLIANRNSLFSYVLEWKQPPKKIIPPGKYFEFKDLLEEHLENIKNELKPFGFESINGLTETCQKSLDKALYRVAITGPSRAGKSSVINALLNFDKKEVSPVDIVQTTAVPIQIFPGSKTSIIVYFQDGKKREFDYDESVIKKYATQALNPDNKLGVSLLAIFLPLLKLQYGVSYVDAAGLDDPNDDIVKATLDFITKCNAIIYTVDASPISNGGFIFRNDFKKQLTEFTTSIKKIFLVFNKSDVANPQKLEILKKQVTRDLIKYELFEKLKDKIYYLSAEKPESITYLDKFSTFEDNLWSYILNENRTGFINLYVSVNEIKEIIAFAVSLMDLKLDKSVKSSEVVALVTALRPKIEALSTEYKAKLLLAKSYMTSFVNNSKYDTLKALEESLRKVPINKSLPGNIAIKDFLRKNLNNCINQSNIEFNNQILDIKSLIDKWIETHLKQIQEIISGGKTKNISFDEVDLLKIPDVDYSASFGMGFTSFLGGLLVNPAVGLITGILGFLGSEIFNSESRRKKQIADLMDTVKNSTNISYNKLVDAYKETIDEQSLEIAKYADNKIKLYVEDLNKQIATLGKVLTDREKKQLVISKTKIQEIHAHLDQLILDMKVYYDPS